MENQEKKIKAEIINLYSFLFTIEYIKIIVFDLFKDFLLDQILENNKFIKNNSGITKIILNSGIIKNILENYIVSDPEDMADSLSLIRKKEDTLLKKLYIIKSFSFR